MDRRSSHGTLGLAMPPEIRVLEPGDLPELGRFLAAGFGAAADADFAAVDVLRWKYLEPIVGVPEPRSFVACAGGRIVGHAGVCPTVFEGAGLPAEGVSTLHLIDWLGSPEHRSVGSRLMRHAHQGAATQYVLVANARAREVLARTGYAPAGTVPVYQRVFRPGSPAQNPGEAPARRLLRTARDLVRRGLNPPRIPRMTVELRAVNALGPETAPAVAAARSDAIITSRAPGRLNHALACPRPEVSGWHVVVAGAVRGFALLSLVEHGHVRTGKLVECLMDDHDPDLWHAAVAALAGVLHARGANRALAFGASPWMQRALRRAGFVPAHRLELALRDRDHLIPRETPFRPSPFEADYAYS